MDGDVKTTVLAIPARDGYPLAATLHEPAAPPRCAAVVSSAVAVRQSYYQRFAAFLASRGVATLTFDYRGVGQSAPASLKGFHAGMHEWGTKDLAAAVDGLAERFPQARRVVVGHSVGGQLLGLVDNSSRVDGLVGVCAQSGDWRLWPGLRKYYLAALWYGVVPALSRLFGYLPGRRLGLGTDLPAGVAREWARWCRSRGYLTRYLGTDLPDHFGDFRGPILAYSATDDTMAPPRAVEALLDLYKRATVVERRPLDPQALNLPALGHFGFFRKESADLWPGVADWLLSL